jgi:hypothetical protein
MTLNIKLPPSVKLAARDGFFETTKKTSDRLEVAIIAALEKMVEIGMAHPGVMETGTWRNIIATVSPVRHPTSENVLIIRIDAGEKHE